MTSYRQTDITIPLDIPSIDIIKTKIEDGKFFIEVESENKTTKCRICGQDISCTHGYGQEITLRHLPILNYETYILVRPKRGQCKNCPDEPTTTQMLSWYEQRCPHTRAYDDHLMKSLIGSTVKDVGLKEAVGYDAVLGTIKRRVPDIVEWDSITHLGTIGIDEVAMKKGHKDYVAVITARQNDGTIIVLAVLEDRKKETVRTFLETIPEYLRKTIHTFCTDMWEGYVNALSEYIAKYELKAVVSVDRFHVAKHYRDGFDDLRKKELKRLKKELSEDVYERDCKGTLWLLRYNHNSLDKKQTEQLQRLLAHSPQLHKAYTLRTELTAILNMELSQEQGEDRLQKWINKVEAGPLACFDKAIKTLTNHLSLIANYFIRRANSGFVEGFNNKLKVIKRRSYGIKKAGNLFQRLWLDTVGYTRFI